MEIFVVLMLLAIIGCVFMFNFWLGLAVSLGVMLFIVGAINTR